MNDPQATVHEKVEDEVAKVTALAVAPEVAKVSQDVMKEEIGATHLTNMGMMAIDNAIDEDKADYEEQLDEIRGAMEKATTTLTGVTKDRERVIDNFKEQLIRTELRKKFAASLRALTQLPGLGGEFESPKDPDKCISVEYNEADPEAKKQLAKDGYFHWSYDVTQTYKSSSYGGSSTAAIQFAGDRTLSKKCTGAIKTVESAQADVDGLARLNRDVRITMQGLEKEKRKLQRDLRQRVISNSAVGAAFAETLKRGRKKIKALPLPAKFRK